MSSILCSECAFSSIFVHSEFRRNFLQTYKFHWNLWKFKDSISEMNLMPWMWKSSVISWIIFRYRNTCFNRRWLICVQMFRIGNNRLETLVKISSWLPRQPKLFQWNRITINFRLRYNKNAVKVCFRFVCLWIKTNAYHCILPHKFVHVSHIHLWL